MPSPMSRVPVDPRLRRLVDARGRRSRWPRTRSSGRSTARARCPASRPRPARRPPRARLVLDDLHLVGRVRRRPPRRRIRAPSPGHAPSPARRSAIRASPASRRTDADRRRRPAPRRAAARRRASRWPPTRGTARPPRRRPSTHRTIRSSRSSSASLRRSWIARWSSRASPSARSSGVSSVSSTTTRPSSVRDRGARPRRRLDLDLVGGERHAAQRHRAVGVELDRALARGGHHGRDRRPEPLPDLRQQRLHPSLDERRAVLDQLDPLDVELVREQREQLVVAATSAAVRDREPRGRERLAGPQAGLGPERAGEVDRAADERHRPLERLVAERGHRRGRPASSGGRCRGAAG